MTSSKGESIFNTFMWMRMCVMYTFFVSVCIYFHITPTALSAGALEYADYREAKQSMVRVYKWSCDRQHPSLVFT